ncbi:hypothetical protein SEVIR_2G062032v4 [Setaria viridis]
MQLSLARDAYLATCRKLGSSCIHACSGQARSHASRAQCPCARTVRSAVAVVSGRLASQRAARPAARQRRSTEKAETMGDGCDDGMKPCLLVGCGSSSSTSIEPCNGIESAHLPSCTIDDGCLEQHGPRALCGLASTRCHLRRELNGHVVRVAMYGTRSLGASARSAAGLSVVAAQRVLLAAGIHERNTRHLLVSARVSFPILSHHDTSKGSKTIDGEIE